MDTSTTKYTTGISSRFTYSAWSIPLLLSGLTVLLVGIGTKYWERMLSHPWVSILCILFFAFVECWLFWGEFRTKMIRVRMDAYSITLRRFGGWGPERSIDWNQLDGFQTAIVPAEHGTYEYTRTYTASIML